MSERDDLTLHRAVWEGSLSLASILPETELEVRDPHGRTALMLAVMLGRADSAKILVDAGADVNTETEGWTVVQEATARGDPELVQLVLDNRDRARERDSQALLSLVQLRLYCALIGRDLHSDATPALLCHKEPARASKAPY